MASGFATLPKRVLGAGLQVVDHTLGTASFYAEKFDHTIRPIPTQTERFSHGFETELYSPVAQLIEGVREQLKRGLPITLSLQNGAALVNALTADVAGGLDDRKMLLEYALTFLSRLPPDSQIGKKLQNQVVSLLWFDLSHPPLTQVGRKFKYRSADGSGYAMWNPDMGKAGSHYARSVQSQSPMPPSQLPSPELIFDTLLKREAQVDHPAGLSSFFFAFANLVIHQVFNTDHNNMEEAINKTSSYVDLAIIYGNNQDEQNAVRAFDGKGYLLPDTFADSRLLRMPPSTPALLVLFSRNHNYIANKLLEINERGVWERDVSRLSEERRKKQDEDIFQTARLVNCGTVIHVVLADYLSSILGLVRYGNSFTLDLVDNFRQDNHAMAEVGQGNLVSIEFTALYHFHATISAVDEKFAEASMRQLFPEAQTWDDITVESYKRKISGLLHMKLPPPNTWTFGGLKRNKETGLFDDKQLADILKDAMEVPAGAFGARRTPHVMRIIEMMSIQQNRDWGTCSLNEFRKFMGLKPFATFEEWNPRGDVAEAARRLYAHPDNIELYVGLQAEDTKAAVPGAGLCPGYTVSRGILSDACALVRGDRFIMTDMTACNLTAWGLMDTKRHPENPAFGGIIPTLFMRALPDQFDPESVYTQFPMMLPNKMRQHLGEIGLGHKYNYDRPVSRSPVITLKSYGDAHAALTNKYLAAPLVHNAQEILPGLGYLTTFNRPDENAKDVTLIRQAFLAGASRRRHVDFFARTSAQLIAEKSYGLPGTLASRVNIVRDVINLLPTYFVAAHVIGLPLKTASHPVGTYFETQLQEKLTSIYDYIFVEGTPFVNDSAYKITRRELARRDAAELADEVKRHLGGIGGGKNPIQGLVDTASHLMLGSPTSAHEWLKRLIGSGKDHTELANDVVALAAAVSAEYSQALANVVDVLIDEPFVSTATALAHSTSGESAAKLKGMVAEAIRLSPALAGVTREVASDTVVNGRKMARGDRVFVSLVDANYDPAAFVNPDKMILNRPTNTLWGDGIFKLLGEDWVVSTMAVVVKNIFSMGNVARDHGVAGTLPGLKDAIPGGTLIRRYLTHEQALTPWASSMTLTFSAVHAQHLDIVGSRGLFIGSVTRAAEIEAGVEKLLSEGLGHGLSPSKSSPAPTGMTSSYGGAASSAATANAQLAQPTYMPEFVGGVGGGANDPAYEMPVTPTTTGSSPSDGRTAVSHESTGAGPSGYQVVGKGGLSSPIGTHGAAGTSKEDTHTQPEDMWDGHSHPPTSMLGGSAGDVGMGSSKGKQSDSSAPVGSSSPTDKFGVNGTDESTSKPAVSLSPERPGFTHSDFAGNASTGSAWDDGDIVEDAQTAVITAIKINHNSQGINTVQVSYSSGQFAPSHGGPPHYDDVMFLGKGEEIVKIVGRQTSSSVSALHFFTNTGKSPAYGSHEGITFTWEAPAGQCLRYLSGSASGVLNGLQGHFA